MDEIGFQRQQQQRRARRRVGEKIERQFVDRRLAAPEQGSRQFGVELSARGEQADVLRSERRLGIGGERAQNFALRPGGENAGGLAVEIVPARHRAGLVAGAARRDLTQVVALDPLALEQEFAGRFAAARANALQHGGRGVEAAR